jgi:hypothetical protein
MKPTNKSKTGILVLGLALEFCLSAGAQQTKQADLGSLQFYDLGREGSLTGTVVKYETASKLPPIGAHVLVQTASGQVDVHLGNARVLRANHFELNPGDSIRIIGENLAFGDSTIFAARIVQKGTQAVAVRDAKGFLTTPDSASTKSQAQIDALRGVR